MESQRGIMYAVDIRYRVNTSEGGVVHIEAMKAALSEFGQVFEAKCGVSVWLLTWASNSSHPQWLKRATTIGALLFSIVEKLACYLRRRPEFVYARHEISEIPALVALRLAGARIALEVNAFIDEERNTGKWLGLRRRAELTVFRLSTQMFCVSEFLRQRLIAAGVNAANVEVTHNGVHRRDFESCPPSLFRFTPTVGFVGTNHVWHGLPALIEAYANTRRSVSDLKLLIVGPRSSDLMDQIARMGLGNAVEVTGHVPHNEALERLKGVDIAVMPNSNAYGSPLKIFEYMALGRAVVAARTPAIAEVVDDEVTGLLVAPNSPQAMAAAFDRLLHNRDFCRSLGANAREVALSKFTWRGNALKVVDSMRRRDRLGLAETPSDAQAA